ncbi:MAG: ATP-binding protein [Actinobacteria bacterium]|nr:ATP-binding protein [Actinomycetota bacterium]
MFDRNIEKEFKKWKLSPIRKPLLVRGARQVGKTIAVRKFGMENFSEVIEINLEKKEQLAVFDKSINIEDFLKRISILFDRTAVEGNTLLFIDEIQESKNVLQLLRFFSEEKPRLHVIAAGSLLEAKIDKSWSIPVGRIDYYYIYPMTFFEYLGAMGRHSLIDSLKNINPGEQFDFRDLAGSLFKEYIITGGMPEVVNSYASTGNYDEVKTILNRLQAAYIDDIRKYSKSNSDNKYLEYIVEYGARAAGLLFNYENFGGSNYHSREMAQAIGTVEKVMLLKQITAISSTVLPLNPKFKRPKKMIWLDVGLVNFINDAYKDLITGNYKGRVLEQVVGQSLIACGTHKKTELYYWAKERTQGSAEVDFCIQHGTKLVGIEVKSANILKLRSLFSMAEADKNVIAVRVSWEELKFEKFEFAGKTYKLLSVPFYLIDRLTELVDWFIEIIG